MIKIKSSFLAVYFLLTIDVGRLWCCLAPNHNAGGTLMMGVVTAQINNFRLSAKAVRTKDLVQKTFPNQPFQPQFSKDDNIRHFSPPDATNWKPRGTPRIANSSGKNDIPNASKIAESTAFRTMHGNINNADELNIAVAPMFELDWVTQTDMYVPEGPTFDDHGNLYFSPVFPKCPRRHGGCDVSLVCLDAETGEERWTVKGDGINTGGGGVLILNDDDSSDEQPRSLIYHATISEIMCLDKDMNFIWRHNRTTTIQREGFGDIPHSWGFTYVPQHDALVTVNANGVVAAYARATGEVLVDNYLLPGGKAPRSEELPSDFLVRLGDLKTRQIFGELPDRTGRFAGIVKAVFGGWEYPIANTLGVDPNTGNIYIAGMADDGRDGLFDGNSQYGAIYKLVLSKNKKNGKYSLDIASQKEFDGGSASTPTVTADGKLVLVADNENHVIALDSATFEELWRVNVGGQVAASVAASIDNNEVYAITKLTVTKIVYTDDTNDASIAWVGNLDAYKTGIEFNALTPTITANGIVVSIGNGIPLSGDELMTSVGMGILDRETGELRYFAEGREESIAVSTLNSNGDIYTANSPVRRVITAALNVGSVVGAVPQLIGGISKYKTIRHDLLVRDAVCAASNVALNLQDQEDPSSTLISHECKRMQTLVTQAKNAAQKVTITVDYSIDRARKTNERLDTISSMLEDDCPDTSILIELEELCILSKVPSMKAELRQSKNDVRQAEFP